MSIKKRLEALEESTPRGIVLTLYNGMKIAHPGPALDFYIEAMEQIDRKCGPLYDAIPYVASVTGGFGKLFEVLLAMAEGPVEARPENNSCSHRRRESRVRRKR
jgi:hypothetical protein